MTPATKALDGGWGWAIVVASFMAQFLAYGSPQSVGVLYPEWLHTFKEGKGMTAWVGSLVAGVGLIASPICSACVDNFGARPVTIFSGVMVAGGFILSAFAPNVQFLIFSYGIVVGLGCTLVYAATLTITCQYFDKRRGLALGVVTTGTSVGAFIYASAQNELIALYGLDGCLLIVGAVALNLMACAGFMRPLYMPRYYLKQKAALERSTEEQLFEKPPVDSLKVGTGSAATSPEKSLTVKELLVTVDAKDLTVIAEKKKTSFLAGIDLIKVISKKQQAYSTYMQTTYEILQDQAMSAYCFALFLFSLGAFPPVLFLEDVAQTEGLIEEVSVIPLVSIVAITTCMGKLMLGALVDFKWINSIYLYSFTMVSAGVVLLLIPVTKSYVGLQVMSALLGFFSGNWSLTSYITTQIVGLDRLTQAHGVLMFFGGLGIMLGPPVVGWFFDWMNSYDVAFYFTGSCVLLGGVVFSLLTLPCWNRKSSENDRPEVLYTSSCDKVTSVA
ncbi:monocarboxylate transporter 9 [Cynoglossus semilaevis]|uniref:Solute carrier family 16 member 9a n=1 Tax=Cynoglossus semilaevis TaxID=244447 RepID=A0A3P8UUX9_CYNSE|nr:monocarboxylate transporter 9 [Cynoglossus semilaevis]XP_024916395.1 monocarboxylate transporter 9 [Cynoglossus semilaevis]XP_024916396.1 monocarboxylate transporter 9 [Cynoglossus semilaevis]XP_024916397.1 monocarboxylate transporter 9 [Cynoglossus semilaevis]XP_024916398.1 monocarboxylate transporter 9 [Cynoglossus semilaevis]XP_024916399.1 monocarboxylate transporter 9 [Cynoglossus semilaevis]XP_024916400.1 monocarboxylate transporter 9 [Cynoglossus semilaevis]XP_024916401.1 monocarbox